MQQQRIVQRVSQRIVDHAIHRLDRPGGALLRAPRPFRASESWAAWLVRAATATYGLTVGIALAPQLVLRASAHEAPGAIQAAGISPSTPILQLAVAIALTIAGAFLGSAAERRLGLRRLAAAFPADGQESGSKLTHYKALRAAMWPVVAYCIALASAPITLQHFGAFRHVILHGIVALAIIPCRRLQPRFSRADVVLIPILLSTYFAFLDTGFGKTPAATFLRAAIVVFALRLIVGAIATNGHPGVAFAAAPLAFLFQMQWMTAGAAGASAIVWIVATPLLLALLMRRHAAEDRIRLCAKYVVWPIALAAYPLVLLGISSMPAVEFFEDGHDLMPASEMARGEMPYRDVIPVHGLVSDGVLDLVAMKSGAGTMGALLKVRRIEASLNMIAIYAVAVAAAGTGEAGLLAVFAGVMLWPSATLMVRVIPALAALALVVSAVRLRSRRKLFAAGAVLVVAALFSLDFAIYSAFVALVAAARWGSERKRAVIALVAGVAAVAVPMLIAFAVIGFAGDFITVSLGLIGSGGVHVKTLLDVPECLRSLAAFALSFAQPECFAYSMWILALVAGAVVLSSRPLRGRRSDALWYVAMWIVVAAISYAERQHLYFAFALAPFLIAALFRLHRRVRAAAIAFAIVLALVARPFSHVFDVASPLRRSHGMELEDAVEVTAVPRARGAVMARPIAGGVNAVHSFLSTSLQPDETFFDFANASILYYLFDRRNPTRYPVVTFYESPEAQAEVIRALERDQSVRAVLVACPGAFSDIDGIVNRRRAPLVWAYVQKNFRPAFERDGVVFWTRER